MGWDVCIWVSRGRHLCYALVPAWVTVSFCHTYIVSPLITWAFIMEWNSFILSTQDCVSCISFESLIENLKISWMFPLMLVMFMFIYDCSNCWSLPRIGETLALQNFANMSVILFAFSTIWLVDNDLYLLFRIMFLHGQFVNCHI